MSQVDNAKKNAALSTAIVMKQLQDGFKSEEYLIRKLPNGYMKTALFTALDTLLEFDFIEEIEVFNNLNQRNVTCYQLKENNW